MSGDFSHVNDVIKMRSLSIRLSKLMTQSTRETEWSISNAEQLKKSVTGAMQHFIRHPALHRENPFHYIVWQHHCVAASRGFEKVYPNIFKTSQ